MRGTCAALASLVLAGCVANGPTAGDLSCDADLLVIARENGDRVADARDLSWVRATSGGEPGVAVRFCPGAAAAVEDIGPRAVVRVDGVRAVIDSQSLLDRNAEAEISQVDSRSARDFSTRLASCVSVCPPVLPATDGHGAVDTVP
ncbi:MAG: hypothetical protein ACXIUZ_06175 [Lysobacteraceae bacterium]